MSEPIQEQLVTKQAIVTKRLPATNTRGSRIRAWCDRGSLTVSWDFGLESDKNHRAAAQALVDKFVKEDVAKYGTHTNPWARPFIQGTMPHKCPFNYCFVFGDTMASLAALGGMAGRGEAKSRGSDHGRKAAQKRWAQIHPLSASDFETLGTALENAGWQCVAGPVENHDDGWFATYERGTEKFLLDKRTKASRAYQRAIGLIGGGK